MPAPAATAQKPQRHSRAAGAARLVVEDTKLMAADAAAALPDSNSAALVVLTAEGPVAGRRRRVRHAAGPGGSRQTTSTVAEFLGIPYAAAGRFEPPAPLPRCGPSPRDVPSPFSATGSASPAPAAAGGRRRRPVLNARRGGMAPQQRTVVGRCESMGFNGLAFGAAKAVAALRRRAPATCGAEDEALWLNAWTPAAAIGDAAAAFSSIGPATPGTPGPGPGGPALRPVLIFLHGGSYRTGSASHSLYGGARLAARAGLVVVVPNYRLGALGYMAVPGGAANCGLRDQVEALRWVQRNAAAFGGDPSRVTLMGHSAGAMSVAALLGGVPAVTTEGLAHRAVVCGGAALHVAGPAANALMRRAFAAELGLDVAALTAGAPSAAEGQRRLDRALGVRARAAPAAELVAAESRMLPLATIRRLDPAAAAELSATELTGILRFGPFVDGEALPRHPASDAALRAAARVPLLAGCCDNEYTMFTGDGFGFDERALVRPPLMQWAAACAEARNAGERAASSAGREAAGRAAALLRSYERSALVAGRYRPCGTRPREAPAPGVPAVASAPAFEAAHGDFVFRLPIEDLASRHAAAVTALASPPTGRGGGAAAGGSGGRTFVYRFGKHGLMPRTKAMHIHDALALLGNYAHRPIFSGESTADAAAVEAAAVADLAEFAETGACPWPPWGGSSAGAGASGLPMGRGVDVRRVYGRDNTGACGVEEGDAEAAALQEGWRQFFEPLVAAANQLQPPEFPGPQWAR